MGYSGAPVWPYSEILDCAGKAYLGQTMTYIASLSVTKRINKLDCLHLHVFLVLSNIYELLNGLTQKY